MIDLSETSRNLRLAADGIWYAANQSEISYPEAGNDMCFAVEDNSFWFRHRNHCIQALVRNFPPREGGPIFDIGGGNGYVTRALCESGFSTALIEPGPQGIRNAKARGLENLICATLDDAGFNSGSLSAAGLFDVLEHIENDIGFLQTLHKLLVPGGKLYLSVPAFQWLWSGEDALGGHHRRYTLTNLLQVLQRAGFHIDFATYIFRFLPLPIFFLRTLPWRLGIASKAITEKEVSRDHAANSGLLSKWLEQSLRVERRRIEAKEAMKFGGSCLVAAAKQ